MADFFKARKPWLNPCTETLHQKHFDLQERLKRYERLHHKDLPEEDQRQVVKECWTYMNEVSKYLDTPLLSIKWPFFGRKHPHLMWELLHRVDENFVLLIDGDELYSTAIDVKTSFDLNIKEEKLRAEWIGDKGVFRDILDQLKKKEQNRMLVNRYMIRDALRLVNEKMDCSYWQLSMNILTSVLSGLILAILLFLAWMWQPINPFQYLGQRGGFASTFVTLIGLGLMGAYLSNLMTKEDFLYVRGGPYFRCLLHNIFSKPVMSAFAAVFIYGVERSKLIFSVGSIDTKSVSNAVSKIIILNVTKESEGYVYAVLAIVSGFAADKILRSMIDGVLKKLEQKAEKTKDTEKK
jgi:hypothetical protein